MQQEVILERIGSLGVITLNRPKKLNTITREVINLVRTYLDELEKDENILAVLLEGSGERAFSAGGDLVSITDVYKNEGDKSIRKVFEGEYGNCLRIAEFPKPIIVFMDGIIMGGGAGLSRGADIRLATEKTRWAMPEMKIGLFPDVGLGYYLARMESNVGMYLGLTGRSISGEDCIFSHIATAKIEREKFPELKNKFIELLENVKGENLSKEELVEKLKKLSLAYNVPVESSFLEDHKEEINKYFSKKSLPEIVGCLEKHSNTSEFAKKTLGEFKDNSPLSMMVTFEHINRMKDLTLATGLDMDLTLVLNFFKGHDLFEGIRAVIVDKTRDAKWEQRHISEVSEDVVFKYFQS